jgi:curved DNA-binding protein
MSVSGNADPRIAEMAWGICMASAQDFVDYYKILEVAPDCDAKTLEAAYHRLAKSNHPDHTDQPDTLKFNHVIEAYRILRKRDRRAEYDLLHAKHTGRDRSAGMNGGHWFDEGVALKDEEDHGKILMMLYNRRRQKPQDAGVIPFYLGHAINCSYEQLEFHKWYLKEKGYITLTEQGTIAITIKGIDHVMAMSRSARSEKLLIGRSGDARMNVPHELTPSGPTVGLLPRRGADPREGRSRDQSSRSVRNVHVCTGSKTDISSGRPI